MKFVKVKKLPRPKYERSKPHDYEEELTRFLAMDVNCVRVVLADGEYRNDYEARKGIRRAVKQLGLPIKVHMINNKIYLTRSDV